MVDLMAALLVALKVSWSALLWVAYWVLILAVRRVVCSVEVTAVEKVRDSDGWLAA